MNAMRGALLTSALLVACSSTQTDVPTAPPVSKTTATEANLLPPGPRRSFEAHGPPVAVETRVPTSTAYELSPDGLILATFVAQGGGVAFYDVDRGIIVGRAPFPGAPTSLRYIEWVGDDALAVATDDAIAIYDGRTGSLRGSARGSLRGFVSTDRGPAFASVDSEDPSKPTQLTIHPFDAPAETLTSLTIQSPVLAVFDLGKGSFVVTTEAAAAAFDVRGKSLWSVSGNFYSAAMNPETSALLWPKQGELHALDTSTGNERPAIKQARVVGREVRAPWFYQPVAPIVIRVTNGAVEAVDLRKAGSPIALGQSLKAHAVSAGSTHAVTGTNAGVISVVELATGATRPVGQVPGDFYRLELTRGAVFVAAISLDQTQVLRGDLPDGKPHEALFTLPGSCSLHTSASGALRLAECGEKWFDLRGAGTKGFQPRAIDLRDERRGGDQALLEGPDGTAFTAQCGALPPVTLGGPTSGKSTPRRETDPTQATSPDGTIVAKLGPRGDGPGTNGYALGWGGATLELSRTSDGSWLHTLAQGAPINGFAFHPSGSLVVASSSVKIWSPSDGKLTKTLSGESFTLSADGEKLFVKSKRDAAIYDWKTFRSIGRWSGAVRAVDVSPNASFAVVHEVAAFPGQPGSENVVGIQVNDLKTGRPRFVVRTSDAGFAFAPDGRLFALAPVPVASFPTRSRARQIDLYDLTTGKVESSVRADAGGERPFFAKGSAVLGFHTVDGVRLVRRADGRILDVRAFAHGEHCDLFALAPDGGFEGEPHGALGFRLGNDLRTSEVVVAGPRFEAHRRKSMVAALFEGK